MDGGVAAVTSAVTTSFKLLQLAYEIKAVSEQTQDLLKTTTDLDNALRTARTLRRQKSALLEPTVKEWVDSAIKNSATAIDSVAELIEANRVEMEVNRKKKLRSGTQSGMSIGLATRATFLLVDSPKVAERLTKLGVASQGLWQALGTMSSRHDYLAVSNSSIQRSDSNESRMEIKQPPTYYESEFWAHAGSSVRRGTKKKHELQEIILSPPTRPAPSLPVLSGAATLLFAANGSSSQEGAVASLSASDLASNSFLLQGLESSPFLTPMGSPPRPTTPSQSSSPPPTISPVLVSILDTPNPPGLSSQDRAVASLSATDLALNSSLVQGSEPSSFLTPMGSPPRPTIPSQSSSPLPTISPALASIRDTPNPPGVTRKPLPNTSISLADTLPINYTVSSTASPPVFREPSNTTTRVPPPLPPKPSFTNTSNSTRYSVGHETNTQYPTDPGPNNREARNQWPPWSSPDTEPIESLGPTIRRIPSWASWEHAALVELPAMPQSAVHEFTSPFSSPASLPPETPPRTQQYIPYRPRPSTTFAGTAYPTPHFVKQPHVNSAPQRAYPGTTHSSPELHDSLGCAKFYPIPQPGLALSDTESLYSHHSELPAALTPRHSQHSLKQPQFRPPNSSTPPADHHPNYSTYPAPSRKNVLSPSLAPIEPQELDGSSWVARASRSPSIISDSESFASGGVSLSGRRNRAAGAAWLELAAND